MSFDHPKFFEKAVHFSPSSVVITDLEGNIQYVNPKFEALTGYTLDEVIGKNPRVLNSGYSAPGEYREMWEMLLAGRTWRGMFRNKKKMASFIGNPLPSHPCVMKTVSLLTTWPSKRTSPNRLRVKIDCSKRLTWSKRNAIRSCMI